LIRDRREAAGALALGILGVGARLAWTAAFPTDPVSDFRGLVVFGLRLRDEGLAVPGWQWAQFNAGLPLVLSVLFRIFPRDVGGVARIATAAATGLTPLLPYLLWRPILARRWRLAAGLLLALWPGLIFFSGVAAQENWVLLPTLALAALAVRRLRDPGDGSHPVASGLLFAASIAFRQEMAVALLPSALAAAGVPGRPHGRTARLLRLAAALVVPLALLAGERRAATGRFAVTTEHGGLAILGTLAPGSAAAGWVDPTLFVASLEPDLLRQPNALRGATGRLALAEFGRRHRYHLFRGAASAARLAVESDAQNLFWSLEAPGALGPSRAAPGAAFARAARPWLRWELALLSGLFLAAAARGLARRDAAVLVLASAVLLRLLVQVVFSPLGRLAVPGIALAILTVALSAADLARAPRGERRRFAAIGLAAGVLLAAAEPAIVRLSISKDEAPPRVRRFPLLVAGGGGGFADCVVDAGFLAAFTGDRAWLAGVGGRLTCRLPPALPAGQLGLDLEDRDGTTLSVEGDNGGGAGPRTALPVAGWVRAPLGAPGDVPRELVLTSRSEAALGFGIVLVRPGAGVLPRHRALP
jgi:Dolichyl-phosphate-mannose-protein mannosyltransferase